MVLNQGSSPYFENLMNRVDLPKWAKNESQELIGEHPILSSISKAEVFVGIEGPIGVGKTTLASDSTGEVESRYST